MHFPSWIGATVQVYLVESVTQVHPDGAERRYQGCTKSGATEQPAGIILSSAAIHVAGVQEGAEIHRLAEPGTEFNGKCGVGLAECVGLRRPTSGTVELFGGSPPTHRIRWA